MDATTNSVYLASGDAQYDMPVGFQAYKNDHCGGVMIPGQGSNVQQGGQLQKKNGGKPCVNLNDLFPGYRIGSVYYNICIADCWAGSTCPAAHKE